MDNPKVSVVIPCYNEEQHIANTVDSVLNQTYLGQVEVIVVDGMSTDGSRSIVRAYACRGVQLMDNERRFTSHALNLGIGASTGAFFVLLGGHACLDQHFVERSVRALQRDATLGCVGGHIVHHCENKTGDRIAKAMSSPFGVGNATFRVGGRAGYVDTVAFGMYVRGVHDAVGGFDEELVRNQDDEYNYRIRKLGYRIYFDPAIVSHYTVRGTFGQLCRQYYQYGYWKVYVNQKHGTVTTLRQLVPLVLVLCVAGGGVLALLFPHLWVGWAGGIAVYGLSALGAALAVAPTVGEALGIALVFPRLHLSYGWGYLIGIVHFLLLRRAPSQRGKVSTRQ